MIESMAIDVLERPAVAVRRSPSRRSRRIAAGLGVALPLLGVALLAVELRHVDFHEVWTQLRPGQLVAAVAWIAVSLVAAAYNLTGFSAVRVRLRRSLLVQLAVSGIRVLTPSAVSTPLVGARFLTRNGASLPDAAATVAVAQLVQFGATVGIVAVLAATSDVGVPPLPGPGASAIAAAVLAVIVGVLAVVARRSRRARTALRAGRRSVAGLARHARAHPLRALSGVLASVALTLSHVLAFAACVSAVGGHAPLLTLAAVYLGAASAGSLVPTPGGVGPVEAALIGGLTAAGVALPAATAATVLSRLVAVWLPALPGWWAAARLRRTGDL